MKFMVDNQEVFDLNDTKKKVICNDIVSDEVDADLKRRVRWSIEHKYEQCMKRLREEWVPKLKKAGVEQMPVSDDAFAEFVFARDDYKDRKVRLEEEKLKLAEQPSRNP